MAVPRMTKYFLLPRTPHLINQALIPCNIAFNKIMEALTLSNLIVLLVSNLRQFTTGRHTEEDAESGTIRLVTRNGVKH